MNDFADETSNQQGIVKEELMSPKPRYTSRCESMAHTGILWADLPIDFERSLDVDISRRAASTPTELTEARRRGSNSCVDPKVAKTNGVAKDSRIGKPSGGEFGSLFETSHSVFLNGESEPEGVDARVAKVVDRTVLLGEDAEVEKFIRKLSNAKECKIISFINANALNLCFENEEFLSALLGADFLLRDGKGMEILYKSIGRDPGLNLNGTDLIPRFLPKLAGKRLALLGTSDQYLNNAARWLESEGHNVVLKANGFLELDDYLPLLERARPDFIILGMGMPKQEILSLRLKQSVSFPCTIVNGGAILDFWGGKVRRAPVWFREHGLEWLFRLMMEPRRLFRRYVIGNVEFLLHTRKLQKHLT